MVVTLFAPEYLLAKVYNDYISAKHWHSKMQSWAEEDGVDWTLAHAYFADMGGFGIRFSTDSDVSTSPRNKISDRATSYREDGTMSTAPHEKGGQTPDKLQLAHQFVATLASPTTASDHEESGNDNGTPQDDIVDPASMLLPESVQSVVPIDGLSENMDERSSAGSVFPLHKSPHSSSVKSNSKHPGSEAPENIDSLDRELRHFLKNCQLIQSLEYCSSANEADAGRIGDIDWSVSKKNKKLVSDAMEQVTEKDIRNYDWRHWYHNATVLQGNVWFLDSSQLHFARSIGVIKKLPTLSENELDDQNKGDFLVKSLAVLQVSWLIIQLIVRAARHLPSSQLEIVVLACSAFTFISYVLCWNKPQDVRTPRCELAARSATVEEIIKLAAMGPTTWGGLRSRHWMPNNVCHHPGAKSFISGAALGSTLFGALHCIAWDFHFPSYVELILWRVASVASMGVPLVGIAGGTLIDTIIVRQYRGAEKFKSLMMVGEQIGIFPLAAYVLARLFIIVEIFRTMGFLPPGVYKSTWTANVPHLN